MDVGDFGVELAGQRGVIVRGQAGQAFVEHALGQVPGRHAAGQGAQLHAQAFVQVLGGQAGRLAVQDLLAHRLHPGCIHVAAGAGQQLQLRQRRIQVAGVVAMLQPEAGHGQFAGIQLQGQALQGAQLRVAGFVGGNALHAVVVAILPAGPGHVPHGALGQLVEGGHLLGGDRLAGVAGRRLGRFLQFQQRVGLQGAADLQLQLHAIQLQQADGLQQLRREVELLTQLGRHRRLHVYSPSHRLPGALWNTSCF
ncbi:hypothetical protein D3C71_1306400 [compost metagenome]